MRIWLSLLLLMPPALHAASSDVDRQPVDSLLAVSQSRIPEARSKVDKLTAHHPNFRLAQLAQLAQLIKGDLLLARAQPPQTLGNTGSARHAELEQLRDEARQRVRAVTDAPPTDKVPAYLSNLDDTTPKRQFWTRESGRWKILHETSL